MTRMIQPHVLRPLSTKVASSMKNLEFPTAAIPQMMLITPTRRIMIPAKSTQLAPSCVRIAPCVDGPQLTLSVPMSVMQAP